MDAEIQKVNVDEQARQLKKAFTMVDLLAVDELSVSVFLCQGSLAWHKHSDHTELFLVHSGAISLESEWGNAILRPGELAAVPKGVAHRSSSLLRSLVLLFHPAMLAERRNGDRRVFVHKGAKRIEKVSLPALARQIVEPFVQIPVSSVDHYDLHLTLVLGESAWQQDRRQAALVFPVEGQLVVESDAGSIPLQAKEMVALPAGVPYRLAAAQRAVVLGVTRHPDPVIERDTG
jgi:mannose-6-phosphate isomerase-like protein (cupin superfamily)